MYTLEYSSTREEVWRYYWRAWAKPRGLWLMQLFIAFSAAATHSLVSTDRFSAPRFLTVWALAFLACVVFLPLWPQLKFKPSVRTLTVGPSGMRTSIGKLSGEIRWKDVAAIEGDGPEIYIASRQGNALIIPARAFDSDVSRRQFLEDIRSWRGGGDA
jgi:hypothetical protein